MAEAIRTSDEGMWTLNNFPSELVGQKYGFAPTPQWLQHVQRASVRLAGGCSGSFVSPTGLVMTNHHCAHGCIQQLSTPKKDLVANGFVARDQAAELRCPGMELNQLTDIIDVTERVNAVTKGLDDVKANDARKAEMSRIEAECAQGESVRCDVVTLYHGGRFHLYKYRRFQDVRLVFAPELGIAFFGGDPDNFMFPRYVLDVTFLRAYDGDKPASTPEFFGWSANGAQPGELTFVSGHPGSTSRLETVAELEYMRDYALPSVLMRLTETRGALREFQRRGKEQARISGSRMFGIENAIKALEGRRRALLDPSVMTRKRAEEQALRDAVQANPELRDKYAGAWQEIAAAQNKLRSMRQQYVMLEQGAGFSAKVMDLARTLVRGTQETAKPNDQRFREYADSQLPAVRQRLFSPAPVYKELDEFTLALSLTQMREALGPDHPLVKKLLAHKSPEQLAREVVQGTKLADVAVRKRLWEGGQSAVAASDDRAIELARTLEPYAREVRKQYEDQVEAVVRTNSERIAKARFELWGTSVYPDATFTLRLSYGQVKGWQEDGRTVEPITMIAGLYERATGVDPFALPKSWLEAKPKLDLSTPMNFVTTNDIIGGNSGSPVINRDAQIVGLIFDGNIHSLGGDYVYEPAVNRAVAVHSQAIVTALDKVYDARRVLDELKGASASK